MKYVDLNVFQSRSLIIKENWLKFREFSPIIQIVISFLIYSPRSSMVLYRTGTIGCVSSWSTCPRGSLKSMTFQGCNGRTRTKSEKSSVLKRPFYFYSSLYLLFLLTDGGVCPYTEETALNAAKSMESKAYLAKYSIGYDKTGKCACVACEKKINKSEVITPLRLTSLITTTIIIINRFTARRHQQKEEDENFTISFAMFRRAAIGHWVFGGGGGYRWLR